MLKITLHDSPSEFRLKLEGRLSGPWVLELQQCWKTAASTTQDRRTVADLSDVDFVDAAGQSLLLEMHRRGVRLLAVTPLVQAVIEEVCSNPGCGTVEENLAENQDDTVVRNHTTGPHRCAI
jgi:ABC-type transporter Mla MlaB component